MNDQKVFVGFWTRYLAIMIDSILALFLVALAFYAVFPNANGSLQTIFPNFLWFLLFALGINLLFWMWLKPFLISKYGGTIGKLAFGIRVENLDGTNLTFKQAFFREYIGKVASNMLLGIGYYWIFKTPNKQAWHDMLSDTVVVKKSNGMVIGLITLIVAAGVSSIILYLAFNNVIQNPYLQKDMQSIVMQIQKFINSSATPTTSRMIPRESSESTNTNQLLGL